MALRVATILAAALLLAPATPSPADAKPYTVVKGDTFSKIAKKFGVSVAVLKAANPQIKNVNKIKIGDEITIPAPEPSPGDAVDASAEP